MHGIDDITGAIIGDAITVHRTFGPGLLESTYETCLAQLLRQRGHTVERQILMPLVFQGERLDQAYRIDLLVEHQIIVELKTITTIQPVHVSQIVTYLKLSGCQVGLLINFNVNRLTDGIRRIVNQYPGHVSAHPATSAPPATQYVRSGSAPKPTQSR